MRGVRLSVYVNRVCMFVSMCEWGVYVCMYELRCMLVCICECGYMFVCMCEWRCIFVCMCEWGVCLYV